MTLIRAAAVAHLSGLVGLTADPSDPESYETYLQLVAPGEVRFRAEELSKASDCGLVAGGLWRFLLATCPEALRPPYKTGMALVNLHAAAKLAGALKDGRRYDAQPGDLVHVGASWNACEHVYTVHELDADGWLWSVDGGQRTPAGLETILRKRRHLAHGNDTLDNGTTRPVIEVVDLDVLGEFFGVANLGAAS